MDTTMELIDKMKDVKQRLAAAHGAFTLFALFEREDTPGRWDVVASAPWLGTDRGGILTVAEEITARLSPEEAIQIDRIVPLPQGSQFTRFIQSSHRMQPDSDSVLLGQTFMGGVEIRRGYILASSADQATEKRREALAA